MKKRRLLFWGILLAIIIIIQFIPYEKPLVTADNSNDLLANNNFTEDISGLIRRSCYDCHSNETNYPWYSKIAPVKWLVYKDINEGRAKLNFSEWQKLKKIDKASALDNISTEVINDDMPLKIYTFMHSKAKLTEKDRTAVSIWAETYAEKLFE